MYLSEILPGNWREGEWPEHIEVSHESSRFKSRRYVPRVNSVNKSSANPVDGIWCSHCGWAGVIAQDMTDLDEMTEPQFDIYPLRCRDDQRVRPRADTAMEHPRHRDGFH